MRILTFEAVGQWSKMLLVTTILRAIVFPAPLTALAADRLVAELHSNVQLTDSGRATRTSGPRLATVRGNALISPAMPVTNQGAWNTPTPVVLAAARRPRVVVPPGTTFRVTSTAYSSTVDQTDSSPFITANGTHVHDGTLACNFLPFNTRVIFPDYSGNKVYTVEDRTAKRYSDRADLWFPSRAAALQFGKRKLLMVVVK